MKALSIKQPWAWLIVNGFKPIENRTWNTNLRGQFLIHAGKELDHEAFRRLPMLFPEIKFPSLAELERGGIVGQAELVDCLPPGSERELSVQNRRWYQGEYGFVMNKAKPLPFRPLKGMLGFFAVPDAFVEGMKNG